MKGAVIFSLGVVLGQFSMLFQDAITQPTAAEAARTYLAYRECIQDHRCQMTTQDWIEYYNLKYQLEEKEIE